MEKVTPPEDGFDEAFYLETYPHVKDVSVSPELHYQRFGARLGYFPNRSGHIAPLRCHTNENEHLVQRQLVQETTVTQRDFDAVVKGMDITWYASLFPPNQAPRDPVTHYLTKGCYEGYEPAPWFSSPHYLATYEDARQSGMNAFVHYVEIGKNEKRALPLRSTTITKHAVNAYRAHNFATAPGPLYEEFDPNIGLGKTPKAKVMAYYLPQFHAFAENDQFWGKGFTEWRNVMRGLPRFEGHFQPRIPRDLGFYSLDEGKTLHRQFDMARAAGIHGFCFYHYWFDGKRVMEAPVDNLLADKTLDIPFSIMWANENWSRTWDGDEAQLLLQQSYQATDDNAFIDDLARHFTDVRYIHMNGRPVFYIYRPSHIPDTKGTIARWRGLFAKRHKLNPLFFMAQSFDDADPRTYGFDGAIEFPPHRILNKSCDIQDDVRMMDPDFSGLIFDYNMIVEAALQQQPVDYPLIRSIMPSWDNDARRPGRSTIIAHSSPKAFGKWARWALQQADTHPTFNEAFICVNAWNEWAEGAYLEPDTHYGAAYLNELARTVFGN